MELVKNRFILMMAFALSTLLLIAGNSIAADVKIGVMNVQQIIVQCDAGKAAKDRFDVKVKDYRASLSLKKTH